MNGRRATVRWFIGAATALTLSVAARGDDRPTSEVAVPAPALRRFESIGLSTPATISTDKTPVILVHGLWIGPRMWEPTIRALEADPVVGAAYQFWTFGYATGDPIPYSAYRLRSAIDEVRRRIDPDRAAVALDRMVVVGHSMGGIVAKLLAVDGGDRFWKLISERGPDVLAGESADVLLARETWNFRARPEIKTVVFIATPHHGGTAEQWLLHDVATRIVPRPDPLLKTLRRLIDANPPDFFRDPFRIRLETSIDELRWDSPMLAELLALKPGLDVSMHSIIPVKNGPSGAGGDDGVVEFASAHLDGVASEAVITAGHFCVDHPQALAAMRRILAPPTSP